MLMVESLLFYRSCSRSRAKKIPGAGQNWTGSATLSRTIGRRSFCGYDAESVKICNMVCYCIWYFSPCINLFFWPSSMCYTKAYCPSRGTFEAGHWAFFACSGNSFHFSAALWLKEFLLSSKYCSMTKIERQNTSTWIHDTASRSRFL